MTPNADQQKAEQEIFAFLTSDRKEHSLSGPPGVGKTWLLQRIVRNILPTYQQACKLVGTRPTIREVAVCATTNRAAEVLSGSMNIETRTIHSTLGLTVYDDMETGKQKIQVVQRRWRVHCYTLFIIDEASMIDRELYRLLQAATDSTCKIVYVGDHCQLAPVGEGLSPVFSNPDISMSKLLTPVRNAGQPALMALCDQLRKTVETGVFTPIKGVPGVIDYPSDAAMMQEVNTVFSQEGADSRILAYTNKQVIRYNDHIRKLRGYGPLLEPGELVVNNSGFDMGKTFIPAELELRVGNVNPTPMVFSVRDAEIDFYEVELINPKNGSRFTAPQPTDLAHFMSVLAHFKRHKLWESYYKIKNTFPDLRARDASTIYKAQGSTFDTVYIDIENVGKSNIAEQVARMLYVSVSRAKNRVYLYGRLPPKYNGV